MHEGNAPQRGLKHQGVGSVIYDPVIILKPHVVEIGDFTRIDSWVKIEGGEGVILGRWVHCASFVHLNPGGGTIIAEDGANFSTHAMVLGGGATPDGLTMSAAAPVYRQHVVRKVTRIGKNASVLAGAIVLGGVTLHEGAILAAGGVATRDIPAYEIWGGVPARKMRDRKRPPSVDVPPTMGFEAPAISHAQIGAVLLAGMDEFDAVHHV